MIIYYTKYEVIEMKQVVLEFDDEEMELLEEHKTALRSAMQPVYPSTEKLNNKGVTNKVINKINDFIINFSN